MAVGQSPLFEGLSAADLTAIAAEMHPRHFSAGESICTEGEPGTSLFMIESGLAQVAIAGRPPLARMRPGEVIGEVSLLTGAPRSATVVALLPTTVLELSQDHFDPLLARFPQLRANLNSILSQRLVRTSAELAGRRSRAEVVGLIRGRSAAQVVRDVIGATRASSPNSVADLQTTDDDAARVSGAIDALLNQHGTILVVLDSEREDLPSVVVYMDRLLGVLSPAEASSVAARLGAAADRLEVALMADPMPAALRPPVRTVRTIDDHNPGSDCRWLGRHLARTKLGLALGAGGAKGFAHIATLQVLEQAGYTVDVVAGSSVGAIVGCWLGLGMCADEIEATMRREHTPAAVEAMFKLSFSGFSTGLPAMTEMCQRSTESRSFADLQIPVGVMTVDLDTRTPVLITDGPLWQALLAATALPGMFQPYQHEGRRLVDGLALVPVPTDAARELGADIVASVNLSSKQTLPVWPGEVPAEPPERRAGARLLDSLLEVMDLAQLESSERHAARADVTITPRFGPGSWRDYHLADLYLAAGRDAAEAQLASLARLAKPQLVATSSER